MADGLNVLGISAQPVADGIVIQGRGGTNSSVFTGGEVHSHGDHRIAMSFSVASLRSADTIRISDCANVATSFPSFVDQAGRMGLRIMTREV